MKREMCPECGGKSVVLKHYDYGVCRETGYHDAGERFRCRDCGAEGDAGDVGLRAHDRPQHGATITPFSASPNLTPTQAYNLLVADMFDRLPATVIESTEGQQVIRYFCNKLTASARNRIEGSTQV